MAFFHLEQRGNKWLLINPDGDPTLLRGANHYGDGTYMPVNLAERYGSVRRWRQEVRDRHIAWGFNYLPPSIGPSELGCDACAPSRNELGQMVWPAADVRRTPEWPAQEYAQLDYPFTALLGVPKQYMAGKGMPDVFSAAFREQVDAKCRAFCAPLRDNPHLIGYHFCHNPPWNPGLPAANQWISEIVDDGREAKIAWAQLMQRIYGTVERWRATYGVPITDLRQIADLAFPLRGYVSARRAEDDRRGFLRRICQEWYKVYSDTIRKYDPNHLILGDRNTLHLQPLPEYALDIMGQYIDVVSVNVMGPKATVLSELEQVTRYWDGPIHLADTGAGVYGGEYPKSAYMCADLAEFEDVYRGLLALGVHHPQVIGMGWCGYYETPSLRSGLVDSRNDEPLAERIAIIQRWNAWQDEALKLNNTQQGVVSSG